jgi:hypothetical protein
MLLDVVQGSDEWLAARVGLITASRFADAISKKKDGSSTAKREDYKWEILAERLTKAATYRYVNAEMQWGRDNEPAARAEYAFSREVEVVETGIFVDGNGVGASPDGLVGEDGLIEIKCPTSRNHLYTVFNGVNEDHLPQIYGQQWLTGRLWTDFISYDPRLPEPYRLYVERIPRDDAKIEKLAEAVLEFAREVNEVEQRLKGESK